MGQGGIQFDSVGRGGAVDANGVMGQIVNGRGHIKGRAGKRLQRTIHILDQTVNLLCAILGERGKIRLHPFPEVTKDLRGLGQRKGAGQLCRIGQTVRQGTIGLKQGLIFPQFFLKGLLQERIHVFHIQTGSGGAGGQPRIVRSAVGQFCQPAVIPAAAGEQKQGISQLLIGGEQDGGEQPVVLGEVLFHLFGGDQLLGKEFFQAFPEGGLKEVGAVGERGFIQDGVTLRRCGFGIFLRHKQACLRLVCFIVCKPLQIGGRRFQQRKIIADVVPVSQGVFGKQQGQFAVHTGRRGERFLIVGKRCFLFSQPQPGAKEVIGILFFFFQLVGADVGQLFQHFLTAFLCLCGSVGGIDGQRGNVGGNAEGRRIRQREVQAQRILLQGLRKKRARQAAKGNPVRLPGQKQADQAQGEKGNGKDKETSFFQGRKLPFSSIL